MSRKKRSDRTTLPVVAGLLACFMSAYGFSRQDALFLWMLPTAIVVMALVWSFWPRTAQREADGDA